MKQASRGGAGDQLDQDSVEAEVDGRRRCITPSAKGLRCNPCLLLLKGKAMISDGKRRMDSIDFVFNARHVAKGHAGTIDMASFV